MHTLIRRARQKGFTLIESMISICVLVTTLGIAAPQFQEFTANQSIRTASFDLTTDLVLARSEAVKRQVQVAVTPVGGDWRNGWTSTDTSTGQVLTRGRAMSSRIAVDSIDGVDPPATIQFNRNGRVVGDAVLQLQLSREMRGDDLHRCITLDPSGLPRVAAETC